MAKSEALYLRITPEERARLEAIAAKLPYGTKHGVAHSAFALGLSRLEAAPDLAGELLKLKAGKAKPRETPRPDDWVAREIEVKRARVEARKKREG